MLDHLLPVTSLSASVESASSFGITDGSSRVSHEHEGNEVVEPELTGFFQPASSVIALEEDVGKHSQHRQWIFTVSPERMQGRPRVPPLGALKLERVEVCLVKCRYYLSCRGGG